MKYKLKKLKYLENLIVNDQSNNQMTKAIEIMGTIAPIQKLELLAKTYFSSNKIPNDPITNKTSCICLPPIRFFAHE
jgi:hypothetical protein